MARPGGEPQGSMARVVLPSFEVFLKPIPAAGLYGAEEFILEAHNVVKDEVRPVIGRLYHVGHRGGLRVCAARHGQPSCHGEVPRGQAKHP
eukprot:CAMPEP_0113828156 /NCGR_PEP_ID=MMETSP0328-20130328/5135_1 /TAXON_ID=39455 /ORGANISM="Alexandrium minutum" /LENGTH=90 /DNA_ID=CAMNT_0000796163 /DNA_START=30 /DNA_END=299 /DNA_ORIENTATION=+ /assembly_acc=CAM_ASM_000350